ncbi:T9SS type A sorting domain-containing protein [Weeksellaceae bacterium KMM 9724]|uniref:T9SS type A sorting domain-containing protein n=1 Tax=Profundicola chukchiensis TaxID=2961959 RepID=UPI00243B1442|nr:T9SS type A sorting domain-containing protein [Profundicola chukchiensis]MDG4949895.1 T9SS type A sorting domain-containing protein [Profundicola chukchiensis]
MKNYLFIMLSMLFIGLTAQETQATCSTPTDVQIQRFSDNHAAMTAFGGTNYDLYVKPTGYPAPRNTTPGRAGYRNITMPLSSLALLSQYGYDLYIRTICEDSKSNWSGPHLIATYEECNNPTGVSVSRIDANTASITTDPGIHDAWIVEAGEAGPTDIWSIPTVQDFNTNHSEGGLESSKSYDVWVRKQCNPSQVSDWEGPYNIPAFTPECTEPTNVLLTRTSPTTATLEGPEEFFTYQGSANRPGRPLRARPLYGMNNMSIPHTQHHLVPAYDYDVWLRTDCGDGTFSNWTGPFYLPTYNAGLKELVISPNPASQLIRFDGIKVSKVEIFNMNGKLEISSFVTSNELNIEKLTPGQYIIHATDAQGNVTTSKLMKK